MKKIIVTIIALAFIHIVHAQSQCPNGDVESGNFSNWQGYTGFNNNPIIGVLDLNTFAQSIVTGRHNIVSSGAYDPVVGGTILPVVAEGNFAIKLGNANNGAEAEIIAYTFTVDNINKNFSFWYAPVMEDPIHSLDRNPFFEYWISTTNVLNQSTDPGNLIKQKKLIADMDNPFFQVVEGQNWVYKDWQSECTDLSDFVNQQVTIYFANADCYQTAHGGYCYIDGLCTPNPPIANLSAPNSGCSSNSFIVDGSGSQNYDSYKWEMDNLQGIVKQWDYPNMKITGTIDIGNMYKTEVGSLPDGNYKITLTVSNCYDDDVATKNITITTPELDANNTYVCCNNGNPPSTCDLTATVNNILPGSNGTFSWYDVNDNYVGTGNVSTNGNSMTSVLTLNTPSTFHKYKVIYTDNNGCQGEKWAYALLIPDIDFIKVTYLGCVNSNDPCGPKRLRISVRWLHNTCAPQISDEWYEKIIENYQFQWNTGETSREIQTTSNNGYYNCTVTWPCGSEFVSLVTPNDFFTMPINEMFTGPAASLWAPSAMTIGNPFIIHSTGGIKPDYNAYRYRLRVYNRWGQMVYEKEESGCGFVDGEIRWDGKSNQGLNAPNSDYVQRGVVYHYYLQLENCDFSDMDANTTSLQGDVTFLQ